MENTPGRHILLHKKITEIPVLRAAQTALLVIVILFNVFHLRIGLADNGDFTRMADWFSIGPANFSENWVLANTPEWKLRFYSYWIPDWTLGKNRYHYTFSSALFLWSPVVFLSRKLYSADTISLTVLSILPRAMILLYLWLLFAWINRNTRRPLLFTLLMGIPLAMMMSTTDYLAYFNSFYQEVASMVYLGLLIVAVLTVRASEYKPLSYLFYFAAIVLFCMAKTSNFYWSFLTLPFVLPWKSLRKKALLYVPIALILAFVPAYLSVTKTWPVKTDVYNPYHSLFLGALAYSEHPADHLQYLGYPKDAERCVGVSGYKPVGEQCIQTYWNMINFKQVLITDLREPGIYFRELTDTLRSIQVLTVGLGKTAYGDTTVYQAQRMNLWSVIKTAVFPRGWFFIGTLVLFGLLAGLAMKQPGFVGALGTLALLLSIASFFEVNVAMLGEGMADLVKHLFLANLSFDLALVAVLGLLAAGLERIKFRL